MLEGATASASDKPIHGALQSSVIPDNSSSEDEADESKEENNHHEEPKRDVTMDFFNRIDRELREEKSKMAQIESRSQ